MPESNDLALAPVNPGFQRATSTLATTLGIEPRMMIDTLKKQCFPGQHPDNISDPQLAAFISVANALALNPLIPGHLYAYPSKNGGIVPVTGPDGVFKMLDERISDGRLDGFECSVFPEDMTQKPTHASATIWRKGNEHPSKYTAIFSEWVVGSNPNWGSRPRHMLWLRAIKQCARQVIHGIPYDEDEVTIGDLKDVTPTRMDDRPAPKPRSPKGASTVKGNAPEVVVEQEAPPPAQPETPPAQPEPVNVTPKPATTAADIISEANAKVAASLTKMAKPIPSNGAGMAVVDQAKNEALGRRIAAEAAANLAAESGTQRALLHPDEALVVEAQVNEFKITVAKRGGKDWPYVTAVIVSPQLAGQVHHTDGSLDAENKPIPAWQLDQPVRLHLRGKKYASGSIVNLVEKIEIIDGGAPEMAAREDV